MAPVFPERRGSAGDCSRMEPPREYRQFAEECRRLARKADNEQHRKILTEMAEVWSRLAVEAEQKKPRAGGD
jgi:hypothetical protein